MQNLFETYTNDYKDLFFDDVILSTQDITIIKDPVGVPPITDIPAGIILGGYILLIMAITLKEKSKYKRDDDDSEKNEIILNIITLSKDNAGYKAVTDLNDPLGSNLRSLYNSLPQGYGGAFVLHRNKVRYVIYDTTANRAYRLDYTPFMMQLWFGNGLRAKRLPFISPGFNFKYLVYTYSEFGDKVLLSQYDLEGNNISIYSNYLLCVKPARILFSF